MSHIMTRPESLIWFMILANGLLQTRCNFVLLQLFQLELHYSLFALFTLSVHCCVIIRYVASNEASREPSLTICLLKLMAARSSIWLETVISGALCQFWHKLFAGLLACIPAVDWSLCLPLPTMTHKCTCTNYCTMYKGGTAKRQ